MSLQQYLKVNNIIDLESTDKTGAIKELTQALCKALKIRRQKALIDELLKREESASTFIGQGIAIPQSRGPIKSRYAMVVGRSFRGIQYDAARNALAHIIVLLIAKDDDVDNSDQVRLLSDIATTFKSAFIREQLLDNDAPVDMNALLTAYSENKATQKKTPKSRKISDPIMASAITLARDIKAETIMIFADAVRDNTFLQELNVKQKVLIISSNKTRFADEQKKIEAVIQAPFLADRIGQIKIGILLALSRSLISREDKVVCITGNSKNGAFDSIISLDIAHEYEFFFTATKNLLPEDIKPEVLERVLGLAGEIAVEGREGKPTGTIFVIGDTNSVNVYVRQLIINPFRGYSEAERNIMDPGLDETIKEFASIDGAFIITGDGIVLSAGSYLRSQAEVESLPSGFGARHAAAAAITATTSALAVTISESTGTVTLFKSGSILMSLTKPVVLAKGSIQKVISS
ncbi:MAG: hypothetical protein GF398_14420 [Chitinivibrionales bacterium]|nr:hypothetical protein [Chitinivibrionales bacterium]